MISANQSPMPAKTIAMTATESLSQVVSEINRQNGIVDLGMSEVELFDKPDTTTIVIEGRNAADDADAANTAYVFNSGIGTATTGKAATYDDGNSGALIQRHIVNSNYGRGLKIKRITFTGVNAEGSQDKTVLQQAAFAAIAFTTNGGRQIPAVTNIAKALRNTQFQSGTLTVECPIWINSITKLSAVAPAGCTLTMLIEWE